MSPRRSLAIAGAILCAAILLRFHAHLSADGAILGHDWYTMHRVDAQHVERSLQEGALVPLWSPWILGGTPLLSVSTKPFSYPPFLIAVGLLGPTLAMNLLLLLHIFIGGFGTMHLARRLGLEGIGPMVCGVLFVLARFPAIGFHSTPFGFGYAVAWWPWTLLVLTDLLEGKRSLRAGVWLGVLVAVQWHAGGELSLYWLLCFGTAFAVPYLLRSWKARELRALVGGALVAVLVFVGLAAIKLLPELAWLDSSGRSVPLGVDFARDSALEEELTLSGQGSRLLALGSVLLRQYGGYGLWTIALGITLGAVFGWRRRAWVAVLAGTLACYVLASGALHDVAYDLLPGYDRMRRHTRFVLAVGFGAILLAGFGLQFRIPRKIGWRPVGVCIAIALLFLLDTSGLPGVRYRAKELRSSSERLALSTAQLEPVLADSRRFRLQDVSFGEQTAWVALGIESTGGAHGGPGSGNALYQEFLGPKMSAVELESGSRAVLDVLNVYYIASKRRLSFPHLEPVFNRADLSPENIARQELFGASSVFLYRRATARSRAAIVRAPTLVVGEASARHEAIVTALRSGAHDASSMVLVESDALLPDDLAGFGSVLFAGHPSDDPEFESWVAAAGGGEKSSWGGDAFWLDEKTHIEALDDERFTKSMRSIDIDVEGHEGFLLLSELATVHPGWTARVDGETVPMYRADGLVTLMRLPAGAQQVRLSYSPPGFVLGAWITLGTMLLLAILGIASRRTSQPES